MASKENTKKADRADVSVEKDPEVKILTSKQEVADVLKMSVYQFNELLKRYSFADGSGVSGKLNGRWHVPVDYVYIWYRYVQEQSVRHPDSRRMRPEEPPVLKEISSR